MIDERPGEPGAALAGGRQEEVMAPSLPSGGPAAYGPPMVADPLAEETLARIDRPSTALANFLADLLNVRACVFVDREQQVALAASSDFVRLADAAQARIVTRLSGVADGADPRAVASDRLHPVDLGEDTLGRGDAIVFAEVDVVVFVAPRFGRTTEARGLRRVLLAAQPVVHQFRRSDAASERGRTATSEGRAAPGSVAETAAVPAEGERLLAELERLTAVGSWREAERGGPLVTSPGMRQLLALPDDEPLTLDAFRRTLSSPWRERLAVEIERAIMDGGGFDVIVPTERAGGNERMLRLRGRVDATNARADASSGPGLSGIAEDVTAGLEVTRRAWLAATHDPVTNLPNAHLFEDRLKTVLSRMERLKERCALVIVGIAPLEAAANVSGFSLTDSSMMAVAGRIASITRESDTLARLSASEFALLYTNVSDADGLTSALDRLVRALRETVSGEAQVALQAACGVALFPEHATGADELLRAAEIALASARRADGRSVALFDGRPLGKDGSRRTSILDRARRGLETDAFIPYYQAQVDMVSGNVVGAEALVRWHTDDMVLNAADFFTVLEDREVGGAVGRAVLDQVIADVAALHSLTELPFRVSVNASRTEVLRQDFLETFLDKMRSGNLSPSDFIVEITEDVIMGVDDDMLRDKVSYLVASGVEFSLDDFGTGYASLIHITRFPVSEVKIDKQFVDGIETDRKKRAVVEGIVGIAHAIGLNVVAEGVETDEQRRVLIDVGCRYAQGFLYAAPLPFDSFVRTLRRPEGDDAQGDGN